MTIVLPGCSRRTYLCEQGEGHFARYEPTLLVHERDPVGIAVVSDAEVGAGVLHCVAKVPEIRFGRIGGAARKEPIRLRM